jgi:hypothetical protein
MTEAVLPYPLQWPLQRPRTAAGDRKWPVFRTSREGGGSRPITVAVALGRLEREISLLRGHGLIVSTNLQIRRDGYPRSGQPEPTDPGVAVYFDLRGKPYCMPCDTYQSVGGNIAAIAAHIEATRAIERYGVASVDEMFTGFAALPPPSYKRPWRDVLELRSRTVVDPALVEEAYRRLARERHPDHGGSDEMMAELNAARDEARKELRKEAA